MILPSPKAERGWGGRLPFEPPIDGGIIVAAHTKGSSSKGTPLCQRGLCALGIENVKQGLVLFLGGNDDHVVEVLGTGTYE